MDLNRGQMLLPELKLYFLCTGNSW